MLFLGVPLLLGVIVFASIIMLPVLIESLPAEMFTTSGGSEGVAELLQSMLPNNVSGSVAMYAADMGMFYIITVIAITSGVVTKEIKKKQWILPVCAGIKPKNMLLAKYIVYGCLSMAATFLGYTVYYIVSLCFFDKDMGIMQFLVCGSIFSFAVLWVNILRLFFRK
jgi:ABC-type transport system involved in multi-copper enzyme maturation permease subunit